MRGLGGAALRRAARSRHRDPPGQRHQGGGVPARLRGDRPRRGSPRHRGDPDAGVSRLRAERPVRRRRGPLLCRCVRKTAGGSTPARVPDGVWERTALLWLNSPHNPTGAVLDRETRIRVAERARQHRLLGGVGRGLRRDLLRHAAALDARARPRQRHRLPHPEQALGDDGIPVRLHGRRRAADPGPAPLPTQRRRRHARVHPARRDRGVERRRARRRPASALRRQAPRADARRSRATAGRSRPARRRSTSGRAPPAATTSPSSSG